MFCTPPAFEYEFREQELDRLRNALSSMSPQEHGSLTHKKLMQKVKAADVKLRSFYETLNAGKDDRFDLETMGVDALFCDEFHTYKNLALDMSDDVPGINNPSSNIAMDMYIKLCWLRSRVGERNLMVATGTPITNTPSEMYTMIRMVKPSLLRDAGINNFDAFRRLFLPIEERLEIKPEGGSYHMKSRIVGVNNQPEVLTMFRSFSKITRHADVSTEINRPDPVRISVVAPRNPIVNAFMDYLMRRAIVSRERKSQTLEEWMAEKGFDTPPANKLRAALWGANKKDFANQAPSNIAPNGPVRDERTGIEYEEVSEDEITAIPEDILLSIASDGRKASLDMRLIHPDLPDLPDSKLNQLVRNLTAEYQTGSQNKTTQLVFCDYSSPTGSGI